MKKILAVSLVAVMMLALLTACGLSVKAGSYEAELSLFGQKYGVTYKFSGSKVEAEAKLTLFGTVNTTTAKGSYKLAENSDGSMEITLDFETENDIFKDGTVVFEQGEEYIKLGGVQYNKK